MSDFDVLDLRSYICLFIRAGMFFEDFRMIKWFSVRLRSSPRRSLRVPLPRCLAHFNRGPLPDARLGSLGEGVRETISCILAGCE